jgi:hypothetical protein
MSKIKNAYHDELEERRAAEDGMTLPNPKACDLVETVARLEAACSRAEDESPKLAAPDGTAAVQFRDLRAVLKALGAVRSTREDEVERLREALAETHNDRAALADAAQDFFDRWLTGDLAAGIVQSAERLSQALASTTPKPTGEASPDTSNPSDKGAGE